MGKLAVGALTGRNFGIDHFLDLAGVKVSLFGAAKFQIVGKLFVSFVVNVDVQFHHPTDHALVKFAH